MQFLIKLKDQTRAVALKLAKPFVLFFGLPYLMILLIAGTIAQREMGLYAAQEMFFSSFILWLGPVPLPGAYTTIAAILLCLLAKFIFDSKWSWNNAGIILTHLGVLVLLIGGGVTAFASREGFMVIPELQHTNIIQSYYDRELVIRKNDDILYTIPFENLKAGDVPALPLLPFEVRVFNRCANCKPAPVADIRGRNSLAAQIELEGVPKNKKNELNRAGITLDIQGTDSPGDGKYVFFEDVLEKLAFQIDSDLFVFEFGRRKTELPFTVALDDFEKQVHPGTSTPRSFQSIVVVQDGILKWPAVIRMNEPLRYKGYTFYQSSFVQMPNSEKTVLNVVHNRGRVFPYIAAGIILCGLLLHVVIRLRRRGGSKA